MNTITELIEENERLKNENISLVNSVIDLLKNNVVYQNFDGSYTASNIPKKIVDNLHVILKKYLKAEKMVNSK